MLSRWTTTLTVAFLSTLLMTSPAGNPPDPRAIIARALQAHGGEANLVKYPAVIMKGSGTFYGTGDGVNYAGEWAIHSPTQNRFSLESKVMDMSFKVLRVITGDKGWIKINDEAAKDLTKAELDEEREQMYVGWVTKLVALKDKSFMLAPLGEAKVGGKPAVGVRVSRPGRRDVNLFFDKTTGLLVKSEARVKDLRTGDKEYTQETFYDGYKSIQGIQLATKVTLQRDGKRFVEGVMSEIRPVERLDANLFARP
jgi:hypothetical protein